MNCKIFILSVILYIFSVADIFSQNRVVNPSSVPTPNQSSLGTYGIIPVSGYTGKAEINVPLYSTTQRDVELNVHLSYDTSGLLINQLPGWTGHNWTLMAGGAITRKINGLPDEVVFDGTNMYLDVEYECNKNDLFYLSGGEYYYWEYVDILKEQLYDEYVQKVGAEYAAEKDFSSEAEIKALDYVEELSRKMGESKYSMQYLCQCANYFGTSGKKRSKDTSADIFYFNFMGISGCFFYGNDGKWKVRSDKNLDVVFDVTDSDNYIDNICRGFWYKESDPIIKNIPSLLVRQPKTIKGFTLVDDQGIQYVFGGDKSSIEYSMNLAGKCNYNTSDCWNAVSWMLTEVRDRFGNVLYSFDYSRGKHLVQVQNNYSYRIDTDLETIQNGSYTYDKVHKSAVPGSMTASLLLPVYLDKISVMDGTDVIFSHSNAYEDGVACDAIYPNGIDVSSILKGTYPRLRYEKGKDKYSDAKDYNHEWYNYMVKDSCNDYIRSMNTEKLNYIRVHHKQAESSCDESVFCFTYDFNTKMHLTSVCKRGENPYLFEYDGFELLPNDYLTKKIDYWGYYNGVEYDSHFDKFNDKSLLADEYFLSRKMEDTFLKPDYNCCSKGMLKSITYPTGGSTVFEYEQNSCSKYLNENKRDVKVLERNIPVGGLRIKCIKKYDDDKCIGVKQYFYAGSDGLSSGELYNSPVVYFEWTWGYENRCNSKEVVATALSPMNNSFVPSVGYSQVAEKDLDGTEITYVYSNFSTEKDDDYLSSETLPLTPYVEFSSRQYMCGKLLEKKINDPAGLLLLRESYKYYDDGDFNKDNFVCSTTPYDKRYAFKLYYFRPSIEKICTQTLLKLPNNKSVWATEEREYEREYKELSVNPTGKYSHKVDVFMTTSELLRRKSDVVRYSFFYPYNDSVICGELVSDFCLPVICQKKYVNDMLTSGYKYVYDLYNDRLAIRTFEEFAGNENSMIKKYENISYYPNFRIKEMLDVNGVKHNYIWNSNDCLIASIMNSDSVIVKETMEKVFQSNKEELFSEQPVCASLYGYDNEGRLSKIFDSNNRETRYRYDMDGRLDGIEEYGDVKLKYEYNFSDSAWKLDSIYGFYNHNTLKLDGGVHFPYGNNNLDNAYLCVEYEISYDLLNPEIILRYESSSVPTRTIKIPVGSKKGMLKMPLKGALHGRNVVELYENGKRICSTSCVDLKTY